MSDKKQFSFNGSGMLISIALILSVGVFVRTITVYDALWFFFWVLILMVGIPLTIIGIIILIALVRD